MFDFYLAYSIKIAYFVLSNHKYNKKKQKMTATITKRVLLAPDLRRLLGITHSEQFDRVLPELVKFGAFKPAGMRWRMYEDDFERYLDAKRAEAAAKLAERRAL